MILAFFMAFIFLLALFLLWYYTHEIDFSQVDKAAVTRVIVRICIITGIIIGFEALKRVLGFEFPMLYFLFLLCFSVIICFGIKYMWPSTEQNYALGAFLVVFGSGLLFIILNIVAGYSLSKNTSSIVAIIQEVLWPSILIYSVVTFIKSGKKLK